MPFTTASEIPKEKVQADVDQGGLKLRDHFLRHLGYRLRPHEYREAGRRTGTLTSWVL